MLGHHRPASRWRADERPFIVTFGSSIPSSTKKNVIKFGPPLTKLSGSAHGLDGIRPENHCLASRGFSSHEKR